ncbi:hypothetical protein HYT58_00750 [Candidatus Woesearchaeota archaeon]|nr:hypothetical protein [Candidatus Woesearchaeota archaeon]
MDNYDKLRKEMNARRKCQILYAKEIGRRLSYLIKNDMDAGKVISILEIEILPEIEQIIDGASSRLLLRFLESEKSNEGLTEKTESLVTKILSFFAGKTIERIPRAQLRSSEYDHLTRSQRAVLRALAGMPDEAKQLNERRLEAAVTGLVGKGLLDETYISDLKRLSILKDKNTSLPKLQNEFVTRVQITKSEPTFVRPDIEIDWDYVDLMAGVYGLSQLQAVKILATIGEQEFERRESEAKDVLGNHLKDTGGFLRTRLEVVIAPERKWNIYMRALRQGIYALASDSGFSIFNLPTLDEVVGSQSVSSDSEKQQIPETICSEESTFSVSKQVLGLFDRLYSEGTLELESYFHLGEARGIDAANIIKRLANMLVSNRFESDVSSGLFHDAGDKRIKMSFRTEKAYESFKQAYDDYLFSIKR